MVSVFLSRCIQLTRRRRLSEPLAGLFGCVHQSLRVELFLLPMTGQINFGERTATAF